MPPMVLAYLILWPLLPLGALLERLPYPIDEEEEQWEQWRLEQNRLRTKRKD